MKTTAAQKSKSFLPGWTGTVFALLLTLLLIWGANPGHAAGEVTVTHKMGLLSLKCHGQKI